MKKILTLLAILMVAMASWADDTQATNVSYIDADGQEQTCASATVITSSSTSLAAGWYVVNSSVTISSAVTCNGDVNLILADGASLNVKGISVVEGKTFTVYAQTNGTGALTSTGETTHAAIGGSAAAIIINGGKITANGGNGASGIGTDFESDYSLGSIIINGGVITATGGNNGAGIGTGYKGTITAITINNGYITAGGGIGGDIAGIGSGNNGSCSSITINGGIVFATGGKFNNDADATTYRAIKANDNNVTIKSDLAVYAGPSSISNAEIANDAAHKETILSQHYVITNIDYLCFSAQEENTNIAFNKTSSSFQFDATLEYCTDHNPWTDYTYGSTITLTSACSKVFFRAKGTNGVNSTLNNSDAYITFTSDKNVAASGNVMSLLDAECKTTTIPANYTFYNLFNGCTKLVSAPKLPATTLKRNCYASMFSGCTGLTSAPELPATTLENSCYEKMFYGCTDLNRIKVSFTAWTFTEEGDEYEYALEWLDNVASTGTFICPVGLAKNDTYIPEGWTVARDKSNGDDLTSSDANYLGNYAAGSDGTPNASYYFTPSDFGFYTFTTNSENIKMTISEGSRFYAPTITGEGTIGGYLYKDVKYKIDVYNLSSSELTDATLSVGKYTPTPISTGANSVTLTSYVPNLSFAPAEAGDYKFTIAGHSDDTYLAIYDPSDTNKNKDCKGEIIVKGMTTFTKYYMYASNPTAAITLTIAKIDDKAVYNNGTLTFYCDENSHEGTVYSTTDYGTETPAWSEKKDNVTKVVFDESFANACPTSCYSWFKDFTNLKTVEGLEYLNISNVTNTESMFNGCTSLTSISLPAGMTSIGNNTFAGCTSLASITIPSSVQTIGTQAFSGCM